MALHMAALGGQTYILKYLVGELKLDVNVKDDEGETPLHCAIQRKHFPTAVYLIDNGANLNAMNDEGLTAMHCAAIEGPKKLLQLLISNGAIVDENPDANPYAGTPLQRAAALGKKVSVKVLLENNANAGADPNITGREWKPLDLALLKRYIQIVRCLLNARADPNVTNERKQKLRQDFLELKLKGTKAVKNMDYHDAIKWQLIAMTWMQHCFLTKASVGPALNDGHIALADAEMCVVLRPDLPKAYYRVGVARLLLKEVEKAADAFYDGWKLDRINKELERAFGEAVEAQRKHG